MAATPGSSMIAGQLSCPHTAWNSLSKCIAPSLPSSHTAWPGNRSCRHEAARSVAFTSRKPFRPRACVQVVGRGPGIPVRVVAKAIKLIGADNDAGITVEGSGFPVPRPTLRIGIGRGRGVKLKAFSLGGGNRGRPTIAEPWSPKWAAGCLDTQTQAVGASLTFQLRLLINDRSRDLLTRNHCPRFCL